MDVDGHTNLDNVSVAGVSTFVGEIHGDGQRLGSLSSSGRFSGLFLNDGSSYYGSGKIFKSDANGFGLEAYSDNDAYLRSNRGGGTDGNVYLMTGSSAGGYVFVDGDNGVELHHAGTSDKKLETSSVGVSIIEDLDVDGHTNLDNVSIAGVSTFTGAIDANGDLDVDGHTNLDNVSIAGVTSVASLTSGRVVLAGTGGKLEDSNKLTFDGTTLGLTGDANFTGNLTVGGVLTYEDVKNVDSVGLITARSGIRVTGGVIEAQAGENKIPSLYSAMTNLPAAGSYHGMFAHVHATGRGYFAHAGNWLELVNKETNGTVGTGTETYNIGTLNLKDLDLESKLPHNSFPSPIIIMFSPD